MSDVLKDRTAIVGIGLTPFAKKREQSELSGGLEAIKMALDDAGLKPSDVDGMVRYEVVFDDVTEQVTLPRWKRARG